MLALQISNLHSQTGDALTSISGVLGCSAPFSIFSLILHVKHKLVPCEPTTLWTKYDGCTCIHMFKKGDQSHLPSTHFNLSAPCYSLPTFLVTPAHYLLSSARLEGQSMCEGINAAACPTLISLFQRPVREQERISHTEGPEPQ
jgi:hypothetical protein